MEVITFERPFDLHNTIIRTSFYDCETNSFIPGINELDACSRDYEARYGTLVNKKLCIVYKNLLYLLIKITSEKYNKIYSCDKQVNIYYNDTYTCHYQWKMN